MRHQLVGAMSVCVIAVSAMAWTHARQSQQAPVPAAAIDEVLQAFRGDLQNSRAEIIAKNVTLTTAQASQFWPLFESYQREQSEIMDGQLKAIQWFIENFEKADDEAALGLINAHLERDTRMTALRQRWLGEFQRVLGAKLAVRVMQIDRRLSLSHQAYVASKIPLAQ